MSDGEGGRAAGRRGRLGMAVLLAAAFLLRAADIHWHPDTRDEDYTFRVVALGWADMVADTAADTHPPFYYALVKALFLVVPPRPEVARLLSVFFAVATVWVTFHFAGHVFGTTAAWIAAATMALAPYQVYWGHGARNLTLMPLFVVGLVFASLRFLERPSARPWLLAALCWMLAIQNNYMAFVVGIVWGVAFLLCHVGSWRSRLMLAAAPVPGLISFAYWYPVLFAQMGGGPMNKSFFQESITPISLYFHSIFGDMEPYQSPRFGWVYLFQLIVFTLLLVAGARVVGRRWWFWVLLAGLPAAPIALAVMSQWTLAERHLLFCLPVFMAYWGACCVAAWEGVSRWLRRGRE